MVTASGATGGEELAVLARGIGEENALRLAERLRQTVAAATFGPPVAPLAVTISVGVVVYPVEAAPDAASAEQILARAEQAVGRAKRAGRNQVAV
jgi:diguanylate cyclase (GGDEF)-like protein